MRSEQEANRVVELYADMVRRICLLHLKNHADTEDVLQEVFLKYILHSVAFESEEHEKAWLIRVATNICKDMVRFRLRHPKVCIDELENSLAAPEHKETLRELLELPVKQKVVVYLHYVEGYQIKEIAEILGITEGAVKMRLCQAREQMRMTWKEGYGG